MKYNDIQYKVLNGSGIGARQILLGLVLGAVVFGAVCLDFNGRIDKFWIKNTVQINHS